MYVIFYKAESGINRQSGFSATGTTFFPEAKLTREALKCATRTSLSYNPGKEGEELQNNSVITAVANSRCVTKNSILKLLQRETKCSRGSSLLV